MRQVAFLNQECIGKKIVSYRLIDTLDIFTYTASNLQFGRRQVNGKFQLITEDEIAKEYLEKGKGVCYKGYIYFQADQIENSTDFQKLNHRNKRLQQELNRKIEGEYQDYLNGTLYQVIKDMSHFPVVKSIITLYQAGVFSFECLELKLKTYVKPEGVQVVLQELHQSIEKAG